MVDGLRVGIGKCSMHMWKWVGGFQIICFNLVLSQGWAFNSNEWTWDSIKEKCRHQEIKKSGGEIIQELLWAGWSNWPAMNGRSHKTGEKFSWTWLGLFGAWHEGRHARPHVGGGWVAPAGVVQVHMGGAQLHMGGAGAHGWCTSSTNAPAAFNQCNATFCSTSYHHQCH